MFKRAIVVASAAALPVAAFVVPHTAGAQSAYDTATRACWIAASNDAAGRFNAGDMKSGPPARYNQISPRMAKVSGTGFASGDPFDYSCTVNLANGQAFDVQVFASGRNNNGVIPGMEWNKNVPRWAIGNWRGYSPTTNQALAITISPDGRVSGNVDGFPLNGKVDSSGQIQIGISWYFIIKSPQGIMTQQVGVPSNVVFYHRA